MEANREKRGRRREEGKEGKGRKMKGVGQGSEGRRRKLGKKRKRGRRRESGKEGKGRKKRVTEGREEKEEE